jgi:hypothetical protein
MAMFLQAWSGRYMNELAEAKMGAMGLGGDVMTHGCFVIENNRHFFGRGESQYILLWECARVEIPLHGNRFACEFFIPARALCHSFLVIISNCNITNFFLRYEEYIT